MKKFIELSGRNNTHQLIEVESIVGIERKGSETIISTSGGHTFATPATIQIIFESIKKHDIKVELIKIG